MERAEQRLGAGVARPPTRTISRGSPSSHSQAASICGSAAGAAARRDAKAASVLSADSRKPERLVNRASRSRFIAATELPEGSAPS
jgi:hypothetical protein